MEEALGVKDRLIGGVILIVLVEEALVVGDRLIGSVTLIVLADVIDIVVVLVELGFEDTGLTEILVVLVKVLEVGVVLVEVLGVVDILVELGIRRSGPNRESEVGKSGVLVEMVRARVVLAGSEQEQDIAVGSDITVGSRESEILK